MKRGVLIAILAFTTCLYINAQVDYKSKGMSYVANGNYVEAQSQFEAARAVLLSKKVSQNAPEFIDVEKKISYAKQCQSFSKQAVLALDYLTDESLQDAFVQCDTEAEADRVQESFLSTLEKAKTALNNIRSKFSTDKIAKANLNKCDEIQRKINGFRENFSEVLAWKTALSSDTTPAYEEFLENYPNGNYSSIARNRISEFKEALAWENACNSNSYESYAEFLKLFPEGEHAQEAEATVNRMGEEMYWSSCNETGTSEAYEDYISKYPSGKYITYAKQRLGKSMERDYWESQSTENTVASYKRYLSKYPNGTYAAAAQNGIDKIAEADAWAMAEKENTIIAYQNYLETSKKKAFREEAEKKIAQIKHEQNVKYDETVWASIKNATNSSVFGDYINRSAYKGHENEAQFKYNVMRAREYPMDISSSIAIIKAYNNASKYGKLENTDQLRLKEAQELSAYGDFKISQNLENAQSYLASFPQGLHAEEVSDAYSKMLADGMTMEVSESEYQNALSYAVSKDAKSYVNKKYRENVTALKRHQRSLKSEPVHFLLGLDCTLYGDELMAEAAVASLGGHSNRFNLELGYDFYEPSFILRPRINIVKKKYLGTPGGSKRSGSDYSKFTLFVAPEARYYYDYGLSDLSELLDYDAIEYGVRGGIGVGTYLLGTFDLYGGYCINEDYAYFGVTWYLGNK